ncbi:family with sequence similarity 214, member A [Columba livia]|uniref:Atos homolog protein A n=1 Tax=Columba livia TaxID=8932 RepID=A0A2I0MDL8_COLLI|nr:family with sequence similarity 214, member A [Columba livia]
MSHLSVRHPGDTLDEYFEYEAEEFLVSLALLITEGRTPERSVKGRTEGLHCPPAQSAQPPAAKHECSDELAQCRQARRTRSEVMLLWKNNIPIMVEVMLLPDCCYSDEGPTTEGNDLNDPAIKQDALLLERWILEPVPRQSGDRFIEEKTLLLAVRSFVFFSQLSAWLSVSHGAVPRNILYRVSAADVGLQWTFSQTPTEHVFPVPNVSHNVALRVSVQSLPRQSNYPVLTCSIHTNLGFYEKRVQDRKLHQHSDSGAAQQCSSSSPQRFWGKQTWPGTPEGLLNGKKTPEFTTSIRNVKLYPSAALGSDFGASQSKVQCYNATADSKTQSHERPARTFKSFSLVDSRVSNGHCSHQPTGETNPLIGSLLQERQEVIARIAQHLIHCDPATSPVVAGRPFSMHENSSAAPKGFRSTYEDKSLPRKGKETSSISIANSNNAIQEDGGEGKTRAIPEVPLLEGRAPASHCGHQPTGESNPLIDSLLQERQEVIARIAQHLIHCDPATSHVTGHPFKVQETSPVASKIFRSTYEDENLLKKNKELSSVSLAKCDFSVVEESSKSRTKTPDTPVSPSRCDGESKAALKLQARRRLVLAKPSEAVRHAFHQSAKKAFTNAHTSSSCSKENKSELPDKLETIHPGYAQKDQVTNRIKQCSNFGSVDEQICTNKLKERVIVNGNNGTDSFNNLQMDKCKILEGTKKATVMQVSDSLHKHELKCLSKDSKTPNIYEQNTQLISIENYLNKDHDSYKNKAKQDKTKAAHDENEDPIGLDFQSTCQKKPAEDGVKCERLRNPDVQKAPSLKHTNTWRKHNCRSLDGTSTKAFHPRTGLPLLSSPVPQRRTQSGCFDLDSSLLQLKCLSARSPQQCINRDSDPGSHGKPFLSCSAPPVTSLSLLGNFEESVLNFRLDPLGVVEGFTAEVGASGVFCPTHMTLPVEVSFYSVSDDNAPSPYMGVITLESLGKRGYRVPPSGTIQVTLFNPNKTVVKMFVVIYDLREMPANHQTFLRQRTFSVPVRREMKRTLNKENSHQTEERLLRYLIHLRFQSSKSGKIYLHRDVRLLFSRKSMEVDSGAAYELKSYTESPTNPQFSPRC